MNPGGWRKSFRGRGVEVTPGYASTSVFQTFDRQSTYTWTWFP